MRSKASISLVDHFENFVDNWISAGRFKNANEVMKAGLHLLEEDESRMVALKLAIEEGIESSVATNYNTKQHLENLKAAK